MSLRIGAFLFGLLNVCIVQAADLVVADGEVKIISKAEQSLDLNRLILGDKAVIRFAEDVDYWEVKASHVEIGRKVKIDGRGAAGIPGQGAQGFSAPAGPCERGGRGASGTDGQSGGNGVDIDLQLGLVSLDALEIIVDGGSGGAGGKGGSGQQGGEAEGCRSTDGGDGGAGGNGGDGGVAGNVTVSLFSQDPKMNLSAYSRRIHVSAEGGSGARGGVGGDGGKGSEGKYINQRTLAGNKKWIAGGDQGRTGPEGRSGQSGRSGRVFIGGTSAPGASSPPAAVQKEPASGNMPRGDMQKLLKRIEALETRVKQLETESR